MNKSSKRLAVMAVLILLVGLLIGFPVGRSTGLPLPDPLEDPVSVPEVLDSGLGPKEMVPHFGGSIVESIEGPWQIETEGTPSGHVVITTLGPKLVTGESVFHWEDIPSDYRPKVIDIGPEGMSWCYELKSWAVIMDARRLANGNYLFLANFGIYEVTPEGKEVAFVRVPGATHHAEKLLNGNYLVVSSVENRVYEVTKDEEIVWSWDADEDFRHLEVGEEYLTFLGDIYTFDPNMPPRWGDSTDWVHMNYAQRLGNGNTIVSLRNLDLVLEITPSKEVVRTFGALVLKYQHTPVYYPESDSLLIFDNLHNRVIEVDWGTQEIIWEYTDLHSWANGSCQKLENGNILICDSCQSRVIEVTPDGEVVWELTVPGMQIYRAFGY